MYNLEKIGLPVIMVNRPLEKSVKLTTISLFLFQLKHMLWVLERTISMSLDC